MSNWPTTRLRYVADLNPAVRADLLADQDQEVSFIPMEAIGEDGTLILERTRKVADVRNGYSYFEDGDVVFAKVTPCFENGKGGLVRGLQRGAGFGTTEVTVLRARGGANARFLNYVVQGTEFRQKGVGAMTGAGGLKRVPDDFTRDFETPWPAVVEQTRIATFLDEKTARIDALIAEKERLQSVLEEWRGAELARICFGTDAATEATGNDWISALPKGWRVVRLKHVVQGVEQGWSPECESRTAEGDEWGVLKAGASNGGRYRDTEHKALPASLKPLPELEVRAGDVLVSRASGSADLVGSFAFVYETRPRLMLSDKNFRLRFSPEPPLMPELLAWMCNTGTVREQVRQYVSGADGLAKNIGAGSLREIWLALPPHGLQERLVTELQQVTFKLDLLQKHVVEHISRLREYRSSLISAAVAGQLDIDSFKQSAALETA